MNLKNSVRKFQNQFNQKKSIYFLVYTFIFAMVCGVVFLPFIQKGLSFVWIGGEGSAKDGYTQHYTAFVYLGQWGREIIRTLFFEHKFQVPMWDFSIGYGSDVITSLHYYAFGDPLNLLSIAVPSKYSEFLYGFLVVLRMYLSGIAFSLFCFKMNKEKTATFAGAFSYVLCGYILISAVRHPFFVNPMIYLPLVILGAEKILRGEKPFVFIFTLFVATISNFYFLYMIVFAVVLYVIIRYFTMEREKSVKDFSLNLCKFLLHGLLGIGMGAVILAPIINVFLASARAGEAGGGIDVLYSYSHYRRLLTSLFSGENSSLWTCFGYTAPTFVAVVVLFLTRKKYLGLKIGLCILSFMTLFPVFGKILNGFSYVSNRWTFIIAGVTAFVLTSVWKEMLELSRKKLAVVMACGVVYLLLVVIIAGSGSQALYAAISLIFVTMVLLLLLNMKGSLDVLSKSAVSIALVFLVIFSGCVNAYYKYSGDELNYVSQFLPVNAAIKGIEKSSDKAAAIVMKEDDFCRNDQYKLSQLNASVITGAKGLQYYWSLENGYVSEFLMENAYNSFVAQKYEGLNGRTALEALASVKYYIKADRANAPFGFEKSRDIKLSNDRVYKIYENKYPLPVGYTYSSYIDKEDYLKLTPIQRQEAMLQGVVLEDTKETKSLTNYAKTQPVYSYKSQDIKMETSRKIVQKKDGSYLVNKDNSKITIYFDGKKNSETYLYIKGLDFESMSPYELFHDDCQEFYPLEEYNSLSEERREQLKKSGLNTSKSKRESKISISVKSEESRSKIVYIDNDFKYTMGQEDFLVNVGYSDKAVNKLTVTLPIKGLYKWDDIQVITQPMENYKKQVTALKEDVLENEVISTNKVEGEITLDEDKILCLSIPYSTGWTATVDGKETELLKANTMYMALPLSKGAHKIVLTYKTPMITVGVCVSIVSFVVVVAMATLYIVVGKKKKKKSR